MIILFRTWGVLMAYFFVYEDKVQGGGLDFGKGIYYY